MSGLRSSWPVAVTGVLAHAVAIWAERLQVPGSLQAPEATRYLGRLTWLTFQTNVLCLCHYALAVASHIFASSQIDELVAQTFPLSFALGFGLSLLYYVLDHFNADNVGKRKQYAACGYPHCELACHLEHGTSTPVAVWHACTMSVAAADPLGLVVYYMIWYISMTLLNRAATGSWQYPVIDDAQKAAGPFGVALFFTAIVVLFVGFSFLGCWMAEVQ